MSEELEIRPSILENSEVDAESLDCRSFPELVVLAIREYRTKQQADAFRVVRGLTEVIFQDTEEEEALHAEYQRSLAEWNGEEQDESIPDPEVINKKISLSNKATGEISERFNQEHEWVEDTLQKLLSASRRERRTIIRNLGRSLTEMGFNDSLLLELQDRLDVIFDFSDGRTEFGTNDKDLVLTVLRVLSQIYGLLPQLQLKQRQIALEKKYPGLRKKKKGISRRNFMLASAGLVGATAFAAGRLSNVDSAVGQRARLIGKRSITEPSTIEEMQINFYERDVYLDDLIKNNTYNLQDLFSYGQWQHVRNAIVNFTELYYEQEYGGKESRPSLKEFTESYIDELHASAERYGLPFGIQLTFIKIASEKYYGRQVYQQEEIKTYTAQTLINTIAAVLKGDSHLMAEVLHPFAAKFSPSDGLTGFLVGEVRRWSPKLPMTYLELIRLPLPTTNNQDVEVSRYVSGITVPEHLEDMEESYPEYAQRAVVAHQERQQLQEAKDAMFIALQKLINLDTEKRFDVFKDSEMLAKIGISPEAIDSWQFVHYTRTWEVAAILNDDRWIPYESEQFYKEIYNFSGDGKLPMHVYYQDIPAVELAAEQILNGKFMAQLKNVFTDKELPAATIDAYHVLARLRSKYLQQVTAVHAAEARVEQELIEHENEPVFEARISTAFIKTLYDQVCSVFNIKLTEENMFDRDLQGVIVLIMCMIREITPSSFLVEINSPDSIKSPLIDAVYNERKVLEKLAEVVQIAQEYKFLPRDLGTDLPMFRNFLQALQYDLEPDSIGHEFGTPEFAGWNTLRDLFKPFRSTPTYAIDDGFASTQDYLEMSQTQLDEFREKDEPYLGIDLNPSEKGKIPH